MALSKRWCITSRSCTSTLKCNPSLPSSPSGLLPFCKVVVSSPPRPWLPKGEQGPFLWQPPRWPRQPAPFSLAQPRGGVEGASRAPDLTGGEACAAFRPGHLKARSPGKCECAAFWPCLLLPRGAGSGGAGSGGRPGWLVTRVRTGRAGKWRESGCGRGCRLPTPRWAGPSELLFQQRSGAWGRPVRLVLPRR